MTIDFYVSHLGKEHNFDKLSENKSSTQGVSYDYDSVMHYSQYAFSNGNGRTIITNDPEFQDVIGQRLEMSSSDVLKLNRLYHCSKGHIIQTCFTYKNTGTMYIYIVLNIHRPT